MTQFDGSEKVKNRQVDMSELPEAIMDYVHKGVAQVRTDAFDLDKIYELYSANRLKFNHEMMIKDMEKETDEMSFNKA